MEPLLKGGQDMVTVLNIKIRYKYLIKGTI